VSIETLRQELLTFDGYTQAYREKMIHEVPDAEVVNRERHILTFCTGKAVLNIGSASGPLHGAIRKVAKRAYGIDAALSSYDSCAVRDLDVVTPEPLPFSYEEFDIIVLGEVIEHLTNPGNLLQQLHHFHCPLLITVPNAFSAAAIGHMNKGIECVNKDHVAWYSYHTLKVLIEKSGYKLDKWWWYNGKPWFAEGLIFLCSA